MRLDIITKHFLRIQLSHNHLLVFRHVYWGEYPHCFAACLGQEECYRVILSKGASANGQDTNGNTVIHIMIIHNKMVSYKLLLRMLINCKR